MAEGDIKIAGHHFKKWEVWATAIGGVLVVFYVYKQHAANAAAASTTTTTTTPDSTDTGTGTINPDDYYETGTGAAYTPSGVAAGGVANPDEYDYYGSGVTGNTYTNNSQWASAATAGLESLGYDATSVNAAIANYLAGLQLTSSQAAIVQTALAEFGPPPVGSFAINVASTAAGATTTGTVASTGSSSTTSASTGSTASTSGSNSSSSTTPAAPANASPPSGVHATTQGAVTTISWNGFVGAVHYEFQLAEPNGALYRDGTVTVPSAVFDNLVDIGGAGKQWHFKVRSCGSTGVYGPWSSVIAFTP